MFPSIPSHYFKTYEGLQQLVKISPGSAGRNRVFSHKRIPEVLCRCRLWPNSSGSWRELRNWPPSSKRLEDCDGKQWKKGRLFFWQLLQGYSNSRAAGKQSKSGNFASHHNMAIQSLLPRRQLVRVFCA